MGEPLKSSLRRTSIYLGKGVPGPWMAALIRYFGGAWFEYGVHTSGAPELVITSVVDLGAVWRVNFVPLLLIPWDRCHVLLFDPIYGPSPAIAWFSLNHAGDHIDIGKVAVNPGSSVLLLPTTTPDQSLVGRGDAHLLP